MVKRELFMALNCGYYVVVDGNPKKKSTGKYPRYFRSASSESLPRNRTGRNIHS